MNAEQTVAAVRKSVTVKAPIDKAFKVFTESFTTWWPSSHSINPSGYAAAYIEPKEGGRWYEQAPDGSEQDWGTVLAWEPPRRLVLGWQLDGEYRFDPDPTHASEVEIRFTAEGSRTTRVDLVHSKFENQARPENVAASVGGEGGWNGLLLRFSDAVEGREIRALTAG